MGVYITNDPTKCVGCNRCIKNCPIDEANISQSVDGKIFVRMDNEKCIVCGSCLTACKHDSRLFIDDTERFFADLYNGMDISLMVAPAMKTNFNEWGRILAWLRSCGVKKVYDVSFGADICTWAHIRYLQQHPGRKMITQPCPAIVSYIVKHQTQLITRLSPVHSPMLCAAIYMRQEEGGDSRIAALSPCVAKAAEFAETNGIVSYNVTFAGLQRYMDLHGVSLPEEERGFDHHEGGLGFLFPVPGGLKDNVEHYLGRAVRIDKAEGQTSVYKALAEYAQEEESNLPDIFDVLNCAEGCIAGTGCGAEQRSPFAKRASLDAGWRKATDSGGREHLDELYAEFDEKLQWRHFLRRYTAKPVPSIGVSADGIEDAFRALGKFDEVSRRFDCGACGSDTCKEMAVKIAKRINTPQSCIEKAHKDISREHKKLMDIQMQSANNLNTILEDIARIKSVAEGIASNMDSITQSINDFERMTNDIKRIASQINIISLNASIEAARAGKAGRAFAVVAEEIGNLANNSKRSVQNSAVVSAKATTAIALITEMVSQISQEVNESFTEVEPLMRFRQMLQSEKTGADMDAAKQEETPGLLSNE